MKNNRKLYFILAALMLLCIAGTAVLLPLLPDTLPMHYDFSGNIDRYGSKYEMLLFPGITLTMGLIMMFTAYSLRRKAENPNECVALYSCIFIMLFLNAIGFYVMASGLKNANERNPSDVLRFVSIGAGLLLVLLGNIMPKAQLNAAFGLRTIWSMANERVWQKSQRFSGIVMLLGGLITIIVSIFLPGFWSIMVFIGILILASIICTVASYRYYKQDKAQHSGK